LHTVSFCLVGQMLHLDNLSDYGHPSTAPAEAIISRIIKLSDVQSKPQFIFSLIIVPDKAK